MAQAMATPEAQAALKFYVQPELILPESKVYASPVMHAAAALPRTGQFLLNTDAAITDAAGVPLPPCFVMERGISLKVWMSRTRAGGGPQTMSSKTAIQVRPRPEGFPACGSHACLPAATVAQHGGAGNTHCLPPAVLLARWLGRNCETINMLIRSSQCWWDTRRLMQH